MDEHHKMGTTESEKIALILEMTLKIAKTCHALRVGLANGIQNPAVEQAVRESGAYLDEYLTLAEKLANG
jgi:hypothetical protein